MQLSIFDEEVYVEIPKTKGDYKEKVDEAFNILLDYSKNRGNPYRFSSNDLPTKVKVYLLDFKKNNWIDMEERNYIRIRRQFLKFHTVEELTEDYRQKMHELISQQDVCWYTNVIQLKNFFGPFQYKNEKEKALFYQAKKEIDREAAWHLGLKHFLEVPSSRGPRMNILSSKWVKKHVVPLIVERVLSIDDYDLMEDFFKNTVFFCGRRDWDWEMEGIAPYPEFKQLLPTDFTLACLTQANTEKEVTLILEYVGSDYYGVKLENYKNKNILYPQGWDYQRYLDSLTDEDKVLIKQDQERLKRLHGGE